MMDERDPVVGRLLSVNVGMPRDVVWRGKIIHTGIFKDPIEGRRHVGRLNVEGDGQGDLRGHGGEQRAVFVYQQASYAYWAERLNQTDLVPGQFGENFTVDGLADDEVCIGDRYRIGRALFEVTQPRVTCYRLGMRMDHPQMPSLVTGSGRPGFYFRVLEEGEVGAGDVIVRVQTGPEAMSVTEANALLYSSSHPLDALERALRITALSPGWRWSFEALAKAQMEEPGTVGNVGLAPASVASAAKSGFSPMRVARITPERHDVLSFRLETLDGERPPAPRPGQYVVLKLHAAGGAIFHRSYSLSGSPASTAYRISVKIEPHGAAGAALSALVREGTILEVSQPRGGFVLEDGEGPVVLLSAGIGVTPLLAMLHSLSASGSNRPVWWLHAARNGQGLAFAPETRRLVDGLARGRSWTWFSRPSSEDRLGADFDAAGRPDAAAFEALGLPREAAFYLCGPEGFIADLTAGLEAWGVAAGQIRSELFGAGGSVTPGAGGQAGRAPHPPEDAVGEGPMVTFSRSGLAVRWRHGDASLLELAEACDVPVRWSCRAGVCHNCEAGLVAGAVSYAPSPLDAPADGNVLICCAQPDSDIVLDL